MIPNVTTSGETCFVPKAGGAVFNTAIALGRLGSDVGLFTGVSNDLFGNQLRRELRTSNVSTTYLAMRDAPSTLAFVELDDGLAIYTFYSKNAADTSLTPRDVPQQIDTCKAMFSGGISLCADPTASTLHGLLRARTEHCVTMIDPNIRPSFINDETGYRERIMDMIRLCDILKISDEDLDWLVPGQSDVSKQLGVLTGSAKKLVFVTRGAQGAAAFHGPDQIARVQAASVSVVDTFGAGDTFNAGLLNALEQRNALGKSFVAAPDKATIEYALRWAVKVAGITVSRIGADPPRANEIR